MNLLVLGATGGTGEQVIRQALAAGHHVTALVRRPEALKVSHENFDVIAGNALDVERLTVAARGAHAVVSALGSRRLKDPTTLYSDGAAAAIEALHANGIRRFIAVSAVPVAPRSEKNFFERHILHPLLYRFFGGGYDDMRRMEAILGAGDLDWTVFRPPMLTDAPASGRYRMAVGAPLRAPYSIARADLAAAILNSLNDVATFGQIVTVAR